MSSKANRISEFSVGVKKTGQGKSSLRSWRGRIPSRIIDSERRKAVLAYSIIGSDGIPISVEGRREIEERKRKGWREIRISRKVKSTMERASEYRLISIGYLLATLVTGAFWQGWLM